MCVHARVVGECKCVCDCEHVCVSLHIVLSPWKWEFEHTLDHLYGIITRTPHTLGVTVTPWSLRGSFGVETVCGQTQTTSEQHHHHPHCQSNHHHLHNSTYRHGSVPVTNTDKTVIPTCQDTYTHCQDTYLHIKIHNMHSQDTYPPVKTHTHLPRHIYTLSRCI